MNDQERGQARDAAERTFALLTASYHDLGDEFEAMLHELTLDQAYRVIRLMAALLGGTFLFAERLERRPKGAVLVRTIERMRAQVPWLR